MPSLHALQVFEVAARHQSFVHAAAELHVTHGAISRQVRQLEDDLGLGLFDRRNRAVFLTAEGVKLAAVCRSVMTQLREVVAELAAPAPLAPLVVSCEPTIAMRWLIPRLPQFRQAHPEFEIHLMAAGGPVDFVRDRVDLALRRSDFSWDPTYDVTRIAPEWMGPVCTPALAADMAREGIQAHVPELHSRTRPHAWQLWRKQRPQAPQWGAAQHFEHFYLTLQAAQAGLGVAVGSIYMVAEDIAAGRLCAPYGFAADASEYVLLSPVPMASDVRRNVFAQWVTHEMQKTCHVAALDFA